MTVDPPQVVLHDGDTRPFGQLPPLGPFAQAAELAQHLPAGGLVTQRLPRGHRAFCDELLAQLDQWASAAELAWVMLQERVERVDHHLRVACAGQPPGGVAEDLVLAPELPLSELLAQQTHQRSQALERLARLVDRLFIEGPPARTFVAQQLDREVELSERHPPQRLGQGLPRQLREAARALALGFGRAAGALRLREGDADAHGHARHDRGRERRNNGSMSKPAARQMVDGASCGEP